MKAGQYFALLSGIFFLVMGVMGFIPALVDTSAETSVVSDVYGLGLGNIMGVFPTNTLNNTIHVATGLAGILTSIALDSSRTYARALSVFYGLLTVMGLIPYANTFFGTIPIYGSDVLLHGVLAVLATYFGFFASPGLLEISSQQASSGSRSAL